MNSKVEKIAPELAQLWQWMNSLNDYDISEKLSQCNHSGFSYTCYILDRAFALLWEMLGYSFGSQNKVKLVMQPGISPYFGSKKEEADYLQDMVSQTCASLYYMDYMIASDVWNYDEISLNVTYEDAYLCGVEEGWAEPGHQNDWSAQCTEIMRYMETHAIDFLEEYLFPLAGDLEEFDSFLTSFPDAVDIISKNLCDVDIEGTYISGYLFRSSSWHVIKELYEAKKLSSADRKLVNRFWEYGKKINEKSVGCIDYMHDVKNGVFLFIHSETDISMAPKLVMEPGVVMYFVYGDRLAAYLQGKYIKDEKEAKANDVAEHKSGRI